MAATTLSIILLSDTEMPSWQLSHVGYPLSMTSMFSRSDNSAPVFCCHESDTSFYAKLQNPSYFLYTTTTSVHH